MMVAAEEVIQTMVAEEEEEVVDWSDVPFHIVELIMNQLRNPPPPPPPLAPKKKEKLMTPAEIFDYVRCGAVCTSWRTVFIHHHHHPPPGTSSVTLPLPPFLIVPTPSSSSSSSTSTKKNNKKKKKTARHNYFNKKKKTARNNNYFNKKKKKKVKRTNTNKSLSFYNIIDKKIYNQFEVTIPGNRHLRGSSHGWLVAVDQNYNNCQVLLFNPYYKWEIILPSLKLHRDSNDDDCIRNSHISHLKKAILSADPLSNPIDYIVMAILGSPGRLAYCRPGGGGCHEKAWNYVEIEYPQEWGCRDVIYYKGKFIALYYPGTVVVLDPTRNMIPVILNVPRPWSFRLLEQDTMYLVESEGRLMQVYRELKVEDDQEDIVTGRNSYATNKFSVFQLWDETKRMNYDILKVTHEEQNEEEYGLGLRWMLLKRIGGQTLFLGNNHSMWIRASDFPGCKPNSIYFTDDFIEEYYREPWNGPHDLGIFDLVDKTIEFHYPVDPITSIWPVPIWIQPIVLARNELDPESFI